MDQFTACYQDSLTGVYDCVDRIVLNGYFIVGHNPAGFRYWWRRLFGSDDNLDETHLMRIAGRFSRRLNAYAKSSGVPVIYSEAGDRKDEAAEEYLTRNPQT